MLTIPETPRPAPVVAIAPPAAKNLGGALLDVAVNAQSLVASGARQQAAAVDRAMLRAHAQVGDPKSVGFGRYVLGGTALFTAGGAGYGALVVGGAVDALAYAGLAGIAATVAIPLSVVVLDLFAHARRRRQLERNLATALLAMKASEP